MTDLMGAEARALFHEYVSQAADYWKGRPAGDYQAGKITNSLAALTEREDLSPDAAIERVLDLAQERADLRPLTVYVGGRGGSGSNWLAGMLDDLGPFANAGEVYLAPALLTRMKTLATRQQGFIVDAVHVLHALRACPDPALKSIVNPRGSVHYLRFKEWDPSCFYVHLIRDPRDQCMSVTYRKPDARRLYPVQGDDEEFLRLNVNLYRMSLLRVLSYSVPPDFVVRYEDLRQQADRVLLALAAEMGMQVSAEEAADVAVRHSAEVIRSGVVPGRSNLYRGERRGWRETAALRERQILHSGFSDILDITRYPLDDCLGSRLEPRPLAQDVTVDIPPGVILGEFHARPVNIDVWEPLDWAAGRLTLPAGHEIRLRCPGDWTQGLRQLSLLPPGSISSLCMAANRDVTDDDLAHLSSHPDLRELDLSRTQISDAGLRHLDSLTSLRGLNLLGSAVTHEAAEGFSKSRPECVLVAGELWSEQWRERRWLEDQFLP